MSMSNEEKVEHLEYLKEEIKDLLFEALRILPRKGMIRDRAKTYWYAHMLMCMDKEHDYVGGCMCTMQDTIDEMKNPEG